MKQVLYDKINEREARYYFVDQDGNYWVNADPYGADMSGTIKIRMIGKNDSKFEIRENG